MKKSASQPSLQNTRKLTNNSLSQSSWSSNTDLKDGDNKQPFFIGVKVSSFSSSFAALMLFYIDELICMLWVR